MESESDTNEQSIITRSPIGLFLIKTVIVVGAIVAIMTYADTLVQQRIASIQKNIGPIGGRAFWTKVEAELDRMADPKSDLPAAKKKKLLNDIKVISERWRPFLNAAIGPLENPPAKQP